MSIEAMKQALDDLISEYYMENSSFAKRVADIFKDALAQPQQEQEHGIEVMQSKLSKKFFMRPIGGYKLTVGDKLYTASPAQELVCSTGLCHYRKPLTDDQVNRMAEAHAIDGDARHWFVVGLTDGEAAHGIKEST